MMIDDDDDRGQQGGRVKAHNIITASGRICSCKVASLSCGKNVTDPKTGIMSKLLLPLPVVFT